MSTSKDPIAAFQQFAAQQQQQQSLDKYLSERAAKYGTTPRGAASNTGWTAGETLANPFAGLTDFGKKKVPVYGTDEQLYNVVGEEEQAKTASDLMREKFGEQLGHKTTFTKAYKKDDKGNSVEVELDSLTPEELNSGNVVLFMGGKTGGNTTTVDTGVAISTTSPQELFIDIVDSGAVAFYINNVQVAVITSDIPNDTTVMIPQLGVANHGNFLSVAAEFRFGTHVGYSYLSTKPVG